MVGVGVPIRDPGRLHRVAWKATGFETIHWIYRGSVWFLLLVWLLVLVRTLHGVATGKVFVSAH